MGDLNYRLGMPIEDARTALRRGDLQALREADELTSMRSSGARSLDVTLQLQVLVCSIKVDFRSVIPLQALNQSTVGKLAGHRRT